MSLIKLQEKIGTKQDNSFGPNTLRTAMEYFNMTPERAAHFFGQCAHETGGFNAFTENLNYSAKGLLTTFRKYFDKESANEYARQPELIASRVYGNRMGNGDEESKEGWKYRGRGALQTTGKNNYTNLSEHLNIPEILTNPDLVSTDFSFESAIFFFDSNNLWTITDKGVTDATIKSLSRRINGGYNGLAHRVSLTKRYYNWVK